MLGASATIILLSMWLFINNLLIEGKTHHGSEFQPQNVIIGLQIIIMYLFGFFGLGLSYALIVKQTKELLTTQSTQCR